MSADIEIVGNAGGEPETTTFNNGGSATTVSVAVSQGYMDKQTRQWVDQGTAWYRVTLYSDQAKQQARYITKGTKLIVTGGLKVREYRDRQGQQRQSLDLQARHVGIIHTEQRDGQAQQSRQWGGQPAQAPVTTGTYAPAPAAMQPAQPRDPWGGDSDEPVF